MADGRVAARGGEGFNECEMQLAPGVIPRFAPPHLAVDLLQGEPPPWPYNAGHFGDDPRGAGWLISVSRWWARSNGPDASPVWLASPSASSTLLSVRTVIVLRA